MWSASVLGATTGWANDVIVDAADDVVVAGTSDWFGTRDLAVVKVDGTTGATIWQRLFDGVDYTADFGSDASDEAHRVVVDGAGDVLVTGRLEQASTSDAFVVMKLDGASGGNAWPAPVILGPGIGWNIGTTAAGDVIASGGSFDLGQTVVVKLAGTDGAEVWRTVHPGLAGGNSYVSTLAIDGNGHPVVGGQFLDTLGGRSWFVTKMDGATGDALWSTTVDGLAQPEWFESCEDLVIDADGSVVAVGTLFNLDAASEVAVVRVDGVSGTVRSIRRLAGGSENFGSGVALGPAGRVAAAGSVSDDANFDTNEFAVFQFSDRLLGSLLKVDEQGPTPRLSLRIRDPNVFAVEPGDTGDPTVDGAVLEIRNPGTAETATFVLPASLWVSKDALRPGSQKYSYKDGTGSVGPCKSVSVKNSKIVKATCNGSLGGLSLDEPTQGTLAVKLTLGSGGGAYCAEFASPAIDEPGFFKAIDNPPPVACE